MQACSTNNVAMVKQLLDAGADPNVAEKRRGFTALHYASLKGFASVVELLLKSKACLDQETKVSTLSCICVWICA